MADTETVQAHELRNGDVLVIGEGRFRVRSPYTSNNTTQYMIEAIPRTGLTGLRECAPTELVLREA